MACLTHETRPRMDADVWMVRLIAASATRRISLTLVGTVASTLPGLHSQSGTRCWGKRLRHQSNC